MAKTIVIYQDEGAGEFGISCLKSFFRNDNLQIVAAGAVVDNSAFVNADMFVMPGGADLPYCRKLNGAGNKNIRAFVERGGTYLGICAGAYYACSYIEYHKGREDEICGSRKLGLVDAAAIGSLPELAPYYDETLLSATVTNLILADSTAAPALYYGGCRFDVKEEVKILARYDFEGSPPAIIGKNIGQGRAILSGVHIDYNSSDLLRYPCRDGAEKMKAQKLSSDLQDFDWYGYLMDATE